MRTIIVSLAVTCVSASVASAQSTYLLQLPGAPFNNGIASGPSAFLIEWSGASFNNGASASGTITFAAGFPLNPGAAIYNPGVELLALDLTVSGAASGNGSFTLVDFAVAVFDTAGATFDMTTEVVGQPTAGGPFGTLGLGGANGDFNLFAASPTAPTGTQWFELSTNGGSGDKMALMSFRPVPAPGAMALLGLGGLLATRRRR